MYKNIRFIPLFYQPSSIVSCLDLKEELYMELGILLSFHIFRPFLFYYILHLLQNKNDIKFLMYCHKYFRNFFIIQYVISINLSIFIFSTILSFNFKNKRWLLFIVIYFESENKIKKKTKWIYIFLLFRCKYKHTLL